MSDIYTTQSDDNMLVRINGELRNDVTSVDFLFGANKVIVLNKSVEIVYTNAVVAFEDDTLNYIIETANLVGPLDLTPLDLFVYGFDAESGYYNGFGYAYYSD